MPDQGFYEIMEEFARPNVHEQIGAMGEVIRALRVENRKLNAERQKLKENIEILEKWLEQPSFPSR